MNRKPRKFWITSGRRVIDVKPEDLVPKMFKYITSKKDGGPWILVREVLPPRRRK